MLIKSNVKEMHSEGFTCSFNCWGATKHALGVVKKPKWENEYTMRNFLNNRTKKVTGNLQKGDILALYGAWNELLHTATYVGGGRWWHKLGAQKAQYDTKSGVISEYEQYGIVDIKIRRFNRRK